MRPTISISKLREEYNGENATWFHESHGPIYGRGADVWIDKCNEEKNGCQSYNLTTFIFDPEVFTGAKATVLNSGKNVSFKINEYEVFANKV